MLMAHGIMSVFREIFGFNRPAKKIHKKRGESIRLLLTLHSHRFLMPGCSEETRRERCLDIISPGIPVNVEYFPAKYRPVTIFDSMVFWFTCSRATPPRVTMATEKSPGAATVRGNSVTFAMSFDRCTVEKCEHLQSTKCRTGQAVSG